MTGITRRSFLTTAAAASGAVLGMPGLWRMAQAQTTLRLALWDHSVPGAKEAMQQLLAEWGNVNHVEVQADFENEITAVVAAEARSRTGHDIIYLGNVLPCLYKEKLEPLNDIAAGIIQQYGDFDDNARYCAYHDGTWLALPLSFLSWSFPLVTRMDYWQQDAGIDVTELFPADVTKRQASRIAAFTWDTFLVACKRLAAAGHMCGNPISGCGDANAWLWPLLLSFGALPVTAAGDIAIGSDATLAGIEFVVELSQSMPRDIYSWDNGSNGRWLLAGNGAAIVHTPNVWVRAKREQPAVAARLWHHDVPAGPHGRFRSAEVSTYGIWRFSPHKQAARDLLRHLLQQEQQWKLLHAAQGVDRPALKAFASHPVWTEAAPPPGGLYNYLPRGDEQLIPYGWPAPPAIAIQIVNKYVIPTMMARAATGKMTPKEAMQWAAHALEASVKG